MKLRLFSLLLLCSFLLVGALPGCGHEPGENEDDQELPVVKVSQVIQQQVTDYEDFTGRTDAVESVEIRAQVTGYLDKILFEPGSEVKKDQKLFKIDPRSYQAELDRAEGQVAMNQAKLERLTLDYNRIRPLVGKGAVSKEDFDKVSGDRREAEAAVKAAKANLESFKLNLDFTDVLSPINGRIGRNLVSVGNLISQNQTLLATVVSQDPMFAYFDMDERTMLHIATLIRQGKIKVTPGHEDIPIFLALSNETGYPHKGTVDFVNNQIDSSTGTIQIRGRFDNPLDSNGHRLLTPGLFVRLRLPIGDPQPALLVSEAAIASDQEQKLVYVVKTQIAPGRPDENIVERRPVVLGLRYEGLQVVKGLQPGDRVVVSHLQLMTAGRKITPEVVDMPRASGTASPAQP